MTLMVFSDYENMTPEDIKYERNLLIKWAEEAKEVGNRTVAEHFYYIVDNLLPHHTLF